MRDERLPVAVSFMGPPGNTYTPLFTPNHLKLTFLALGSDVMLANVLKESFIKANRPLSVKVGSVMYT